MRFFDMHLSTLSLQTTAAPWVMRGSLLGTWMNVGEGPLANAHGAGSIDEAWVARFHEGDKKLLTEVYTVHFDAVLGAARRYLREADAETCVQEVFLRMVSEPSFRAKFSGGSPRAWLCTIARNRAIDTLRKRGREEMTEPQDIEKHAGAMEGERFVEQAEARRVVQQFRKEALPEKWAGVFEARFIKQLSQREAARELQTSRTTLAYQEMRVRSLFEQFVLTRKRSDGSGKAVGAGDD